MRNPLPLRALRPRRRRYIQAPAPSLFSVFTPLVRMASLFGSYDSDPVASAERGRLISMADQQIRTIQRENEQARFCNGVILDPNRNQYI